MTTTFSPLSGSPDLAKNENKTISSPDQQQQQQHQQPRATASAKPATKSKPRKRVNTAEKRHQHNAIERARRETLNGRFGSLARCLPALASHRRPSKSAIVNGSISHHTYQRDQRLLAAKLFRSLCPEYDAMLSEVNHWRKLNNCPPKDSRSAWTEEVEEVCGVEKEVFGTFQNFDGGDGDDDEGDIIPEQVATVPTTSGFSNVNGLITPRSSADLDALAHAQSMFGNISVPNSQPVPPMAGLNWSNDFALHMNSNAQPSLGFAPFMAESTVDRSSTTGSPTNSQHAAVVTPPTTAVNTLVYDHTPSPHSSHSFEDVKPSMPTPNQMAGWNPQQQLLFLQQAQLRRQQQHQQQQQQQQNHNVPGWPQCPTTQFPMTQSALFPAVMNGPPEDLTQQLLSSMFPNNTATPDQVQQWRKAALGHLMPQNRQAIQTQPAFDHGIPTNNMGLTLNGDGLWPQSSNHPLEGF